MSGCRRRDGSWNHASIIMLRDRRRSITLSSNNSGQDVGLFERYRLESVQVKPTDSAKYYLHGRLSRPLIQATQVGFVYTVISHCFQTSSYADSWFFSQIHGDILLECSARALSGLLFYFKLKYQCPNLKRCDWLRSPLSFSCACAREEGVFRDHNWWIRRDY